MGIHRTFRVEREWPHEPITVLGLKPEHDGAGPDMPPDVIREFDAALEEFRMCRFIDPSEEPVWISPVKIVTIYEIEEAK